MTDDLRKEAEAAEYIFDLEFFERQVGKDAKRFTESNFPVEFYGERILVYEAWGMRDLLEMAYEYGMRKGAKAERERSEKLVKALEGCEGGDLASGDGIYKAEIARAALAAYRKGQT